MVSIALTFWQRNQRKHVLNPTSWGTACSTFWLWSLCFGKNGPIVLWFTVWGNTLFLSGGIFAVWVELARRLGSCGRPSFLIVVIWSEIIAVIVHHDVGHHHLVLQRFKAIDILILMMLLILLLPFPVRDTIESELTCRMVFLMLNLAWT